MNNELIEMPIEVQLIEHPDDQLTLSGYTSIPVSELSSYGVAGNELFKMVGSINAASGGEGIYRVTFPEGFNGSLTKFVNEEYYMGSLREGGKFAGQARLSPLSFDPSMLFISLVLMDINSKLSVIIENQMKLLEYAYEKEESIIRGDFNMINDSINMYKYNYDQDKFINQNISLVSSIKNDVFKSMDLSKRQIDGLLATPNNPHMLKTAGKKVKELTRFVGQYHDAIMLLSYASFYEVLLHKNFRKDYLKNVIESLRTRSNDYSLLHQKCFEWGKSYIESSVNYKAAPLLSGADWVWEEGLKRLPFDYDKKYAVDGEYYQSAEKQLEQLVDFGDVGVSIYIKEIKRLDSLHNKCVKLLVNKDCVYLQNDDAVR